MMLFGHHRRHKVGMLYMFHSMMLFFFFHVVSIILRRVVCVCFEVCFIVLHVRLFWVCFEQIDVVSTNSVT